MKNPARYRVMLSKILRRNKHPSCIIGYNHPCLPAKRHLLFREFCSSHLSVKQKYKKI